MEADGDHLKSRSEGNENSLTERCSDVPCEGSSLAEGVEGAVVQNKAGNSSDEERAAGVNADEVGGNATAREETESGQSDDADDDEDDQIQENEFQETTVVQQVEFLFNYF